MLLLDVSKETGSEGFQLETGSQRDSCIDASNNLLDVLQCKLAEHLTLPTLWL
jgi:hypothetical protein